MPTVILSILLALVYSYMVRYVPTFSLQSWHAIAFFNGFLALLLWVGNRRWKIAEVDSHGSFTIQKLAWLSPFVIMLCVGTLIVLSPKRVPWGTYTVWDIALLCLFIPVMEELIFRRYFTSWLYDKFPDSPALVVFTSALVFALAHASLPKLVIPIGAYLLGLVTSAIYMSTGRILAPILFHAACNASAVLFTLYSPVWLDRLGWLYLKL